MKGGRSSNQNTLHGRGVKIFWYNTMVNIHMVSDIVLSVDRTLNGT